MDSMSHDPAAGDIGSQLVDIGSQGLSAGSTAAMSVLSGLIPAGAEEVSAQAVLAFAQEAASMLASNTAAQEELMRTGTALTDIARMYSDSDDNAAGALTFSAAAMSRPASATGSTGGAGLLGGLPAQAQAEALARSPLVSQAVEASSSPMVSTAASAGSSAMGGGAPVGSGMGAGAPAGAAKPGLASATEPADDDDRDANEQVQPGERLT
ncbi:PE family protein [Mycobacterium angelicum]|uniref:PE family protein n=1 Tax=Mycobacterium angelicum TaxID=470074 RepID=A0A1W9ZXZ7_MYCAN|nr:PE family protein [Mycobacterium angelicum]MCV7195212.1 PE family protein [Mycobacterium angelicum]ORA22641.1 PE family protein [Mycobacterium angelicum]